MNTKEMNIKEMEKISGGENTDFSISEPGTLRPQPVGHPMPRPRPSGFPMPRPKD